MSSQRSDKSRNRVRFRLRIYELDELLRIFECESLTELRLMLTWMRIEPFYVHPVEYISLTNYQLPASVRERAERLFPLH